MPLFLLSLIKPAFTIAAAASQAGAFPVTQEAEQAFAGHEACTANESQEWINEIMA
jgi:hypothetical protein